MEDHYKHPPDEKKVRFRLNLLGSKKENKIWVIIITTISFFLSVFLSFFSTNILEQADLVIASIVVLTIILIGILFDIIGIAVTAADEAPFHAMGSRKLYGARESIKLIRNADKVSNFCNDVVGDICGIISGTASAYIVTILAGGQTVSETSVAALGITGLVASMTVGGKAIGKSIAIENSNFIIYKVGVISKFFTSRINRDKKRKK
ncbi:MAG: hypothetical protein K0R31_1513 [Clostridiales bacterium]|jgi:hypothetical protein|nr:hypothetical protein [Clostridiales bacterium]